MKDNLTPEDKRLLTKEELKQAINKALQNAEINNIPPSQEELRVITSKAQLAKDKDYWEKKLREMALNYDVIIRTTKELAKVDKCPKCGGSRQINTKDFYTEAPKTNPCHICQGTGKARPSREEIAKLAWQKEYDRERNAGKILVEVIWELLPEFAQNYYLEVADQILATCQGKRAGPDMEIRVAELICEDCDHQGDKAFPCLKKLPCVYAEGLANGIIASMEGE